MSTEADPGATLPYAFDLWYPIACGPMRCRAVVSARAHGAQVRGRRVWRSLGPGESMLVIDRDGRGLVRGLLGRLFTRSAIGRFRAQLGAKDELARVERFHALPNTGGSWVLIPCDPHAATTAGLTLLPAGRARWRFAKSLLARWPKVGRRVLACFDQVALLTKTGELVDPGPYTLPACVRPGETRAAIACGVPGRFQKIVAQITDSGGETVAFLKLSKTTDARERVERESKALVQIEELGLARIAPRVLDCGEHRGVRFVVLEPLFGTRAPASITRRHLAFLETLRAATEDACPIAAIGAFALAQRALPVLLLQSDEAGRARALALSDLARAVVEHVGAQSLACTLAHGDFAPWNLVETDTGLRAYDWEQMQRRMPALYDLVHFCVQTGVLVHQASAATIAMNLERLLSGPARDHAEACGIADRPTGAFPGEVACDWRIYAALYLVIHATFEELDHRVETPPFAQVEWLRTARTELAGLLADELRRSAPATRRRAA
ncbi:MAG: hypothetical protein GY711_34895 [bacterium]|nr:hypothetical protein [bacterium]